MNNEPVAWMGKDYDGLKTDLYFDVERNKLPYRLYESAIPLYTHPVKEQLTDEEIALTWNEFSALQSPKDIKDFARAILLKVQDLEFEQEGYENLTEMLESEKAELTEKNCQQQAEIDKLKNLLLDNQILLDKTLNAWAKEMERKK